MLEVSAVKYIISFRVLNLKPIISYLSLHPIGLLFIDADVPYALGTTKQRIGFNKYLHVAIHFILIALIVGLLTTPPAHSAAYHFLPLLNLQLNYLVYMWKLVKELLLYRTTVKHLYNRCVRPVKISL